MNPNYDDDEQYSLSGFKKINNNNDDQYSLSSFKKKNKKEGKGIKGIGLDLMQGIENAPGSLWNSLKELPGEAYGAGKQVLTDPLRAAQNLGGGLGDLGHGILSSAGNIRDYLAKKDIVSNESPSFRLPESVLPKEYNYQKSLGRKGNKQGDALLSSAIPAASFGALGELGIAGKGFKAGITKAGKRIGAGGLYGISENENPITSGLVNAALPKALETLAKVPSKTLNAANKAIHPIKTAKNAQDILADKLANMAIAYARRNEKSGGSLNAEDAARNIEKNYTNITGEQMPVDLGTILNNKVLKTLYKMSTKVPLSGGKRKITQFEKERFEKEAHEEEKGYKKQLEELAHKRFKEQSNQDYATQQLEESRNNERLNQPGNIASQENMQPYQEALSRHINETPTITNQLRHRGIAHGDLLKQETQSAYNRARNESEELYAPVNHVPTEPLGLNSLTDFPTYAHEVHNLHINSAHMQEMFGNDRDIGNQAARELENAVHLFRNNAPINNIGSLREHIQNLQKIGAQLSENGHRTEGSRISALGRNLKNDLIARMRERGFNDEADALRAADRHYIHEVLPFYTNKMIRNTAVTDFMPEPTSLSKTLHNANNRNILNRLSPEARNATAYEAITKGKYGTHETNFTPEKLSQNYASLSHTQRQAIHDINPGINERLSELPRSMNLHERLTQGINEAANRERNLRQETNTEQGVAYNQHEKATEAIKNLDNLQSKAKENLQKVIDKKLGKPEIKSQGIGAGLKNLSPIHAGGLGFALSAFIGPFAKAGAMKHLLEAGIITIPFARALTKALTRADTAKHYIEGTKFEKKINPESTLSKNLKKGLSKLHAPVLGINQEKRKPLELELRKSSKDYK